MENLKPRRQIPKKGKKKPIKITYISNPMRVQANDEFEFRSLVQELTGKNSTIAYAEEEEEAHHEEFSMINGVNSQSSACFYSNPPEAPPPITNNIITKCEEQVISSALLSNLDIMETSLWIELYGFQSPYVLG